MRVPHCLLLALASLPALVIAKDLPVIHHDALNIIGAEHPESPEVVGT
jgi:hypothetical protein